MLRLDRLAVGSVSCCAAAIIAVAAVPALCFAYHDPALHMTFTTTAALTTSSVVLLLVRRFPQSRCTDQVEL